MREIVKNEAPHSWGEDRRKWHFDPNVLLSAIVALIIATASFGVTMVYWYSEVETRFEQQTQVNTALKLSDHRIVDQLAKMDGRWQRQQNRRSAEVDKNFELLRSEMYRVRALLEQIAFNTHRKGKGKDQ